MSKEKPAPRDEGIRREVIRGHEVAFPTRVHDRRVFIDGRPTRYAVVGGRYSLSAYAYDPAPTLEEVVKRYIDYLERVGRARKGG